MTKNDRYLANYIKMLEKEKALTEKFKSEMEKISEAKDKVTNFLSKEDVTLEVQDIICQESPYFAWLIGEKNDALAIRLYRILRDKVTAGNREAKDFEAEQNFFKDKIGNWLLDALNKSGAKSVNCGEEGKAYKKMKTQVSAADWGAFVDWAAENGAQDAIQKRVNASFVNTYEEENKEPPPYLNIVREYQVVVTK